MHETLFSSRSSHPSQDPIADRLARLLPSSSSLYVPEETGAKARAGVPVISHLIMEWRWWVLCLGGCVCLSLSFLGYNPLGTCNFNYSLARSEHGMEN